MLEIEIRQAMNAVEYAKTEVDDLEDTLAKAAAPECTLGVFVKAPDCTPGCERHVDTVELDRPALLAMIERSLGRARADLRRKREELRAYHRAAAEAPLD